MLKYLDRRESGFNIFSARANQKRNDHDLGTSCDAASRAQPGLRQQPRSLASCAATDSMGK
jgi:hypothetical protein